MRGGGGVRADELPGEWQARADAGLLGLVGVQRVRRLPPRVLALVEAIYPVVG